MTDRQHRPDTNQTEGQAAPKQAKAARRGYGSLSEAAMLGLTSATAIPGELGSSAWSEAANNLADPTRAWSEPDPQ